MIGKLTYGLVGHLEAAVWSKGKKGMAMNADLAHLLLSEKQNEKSKEAILDFRAVYEDRYSRRMQLLESLSRLFRSYLLPSVTPDLSGKRRDLDNFLQRDWMYFAEPF